MHVGLMYLLCALFTRPASLSSLHRYNRAVLLMHVGRWEEAEADLRKYIEVDPSDADSHEQLAKALGHQKGKAEAALQAQAISTVLKN
jgi:predicted Zn-dependent protease